MIAWVNETKHSSIVRVQNHLMAKDCGDSPFISTNECCSTQPNYIYYSFAMFSFCFCFRLFFPLSLSERYTFRYATVPCLQANRLTFHWCTQCAHKTSFVPCSFISYWKRSIHSACRLFNACKEMRVGSWKSFWRIDITAYPCRHTGAQPFHFQSFYATSKFIPTTINFVSSAKRLSDPL